MVGIDTKMPVCIAPVGLTGVLHAMQTYIQRSNGFRAHWLPEKDNQKTVMA
jgi:hypothetical protein